ncbi:hypothetical protein K443DRAFT_86677 [Laccaria amethystina LaAM-08-1]|uniref:Long chronological lifespan protein 2 n=1 Tax=Laccaria amethystina LaAM-08-1 TaxID=1095629 RepID=A0A0C9YBE4_9AGAR|nr:hypothetical protein K443DRAFT_86677 [Laccaria amethystina LaAM-08-1]
MHKFTSSLGLFLAMVSLAVAAPSPAESSVPATLVRANGALLITAAASPSANEAGHRSALEPDSSEGCLPPDEWCPPNRVCCGGFCTFGRLCPDSNKVLTEGV